MMKSAQDPPASSEPSYMLFCPICRVEKKVVAAVRPASITDNDDESPSSDVVPTNITRVDVENKRPIYRLTNCEHEFCLPCVRAYVASKIGDGKPSIPCCHSRVLGTSGNVRQCNAVIDELDIYNLLHTIVGDVDDDYCCYDDDDGSSSLFDADREGGWSSPRKKIRGRGASSKGTRMNDVNVESHLVVDDDELTSSTALNLTASKEEGDEGGMVENELWMKYKKLKFDRDHGKNAVRRCPRCDEAILFDFRIMKQFQDQFLTDSSSSNVVAVTVDDDNVPTSGNAKRRKGILNVVRRWQNNGAIDSGGDGGTASSAKEGNNVVVNDPSLTETLAMARESEYIMETRHVQEEINMRDDTDNTSLNDIEPILSSLSSANNNNNKEEDAYITQDGGESVKIEDETNNEQDLSYMTKTTTQNKNDDFDAEICHLNEKAPAAELCYSCETVDIATMKIEVLSPPVQLKSTTPCVTCPTCTTNFCYFHSNAHAFGTSACITYHTNSIESDRINLEYASQTLHAKSCPTCGIAVSKEGGCNQMKCGSCGTHFCWICSAIVDDGAFPEHFRWWNITGCANMQLDETNDPMKLTIIWARVLSIFQIVFFGIPAVILTLISIIVCPCVAIGCGATTRERVVNFISFWGSFLSSMLLLPFACLGLFIMAAVYCFVAAFSFLLKLTKARRRSTELSEVDTPRRRLSNSNRNPNTALRDLSSMIDRMEEGRSSS